MNAINKEPERHEIEALLPWHAAGTLSRRDADRVEQALAGDRELARRYDLVREELAETIHLNETLGAPSARAMEKLFAAIDAEEARSPRRQRSFDLAGRISEFLSSLTPRALAWSATSCGRCKRNRRSSASSPRRSRPSGDGLRCGRSRRPPLPLLRRVLTCCCQPPNRTTRRRRAWRCGKALTATTRGPGPPTTSIPIPGYAAGQSSRAKLARSGRTAGYSGRDLVIL